MTISNPDLDGFVFRCDCDRWHGRLHSSYDRFAPSHQFLLTVKLGKSQRTQLVANSRDLDALVDLLTVMRYECLKRGIPISPAGEEEA